MHDYCSLADVARYTDLKRSQIEYLVKSGVVVPAANVGGGSGKHRGFTFMNVLEFAVAGALMAVGLDMARIKRVFEQLATGPSSGGSALGSLSGAPERMFLVFHAGGAITSASELFAHPAIISMPALQHFITQGHSVIAIDLQAIYRQLVERVRATPPEGQP